MKAKIIHEKCTMCQACLDLEVCPKGAIDTVPLLKITCQTPCNRGTCFSGFAFDIDKNLCDGCGTCLKVCPQNAIILIEEKIPERRGGKSNATLRV